MTGDVVMDGGGAADSMVTLDDHRSTASSGLLGAARATGPEDDFYQSVMTGGGNEVGQP